MAIEALAEHGLDIEETDRLLLTIQLALAARDLYFASADYDPTDQELDEHFVDFVVDSRIRRSSRVAA